MTTHIITFDFNIGKHIAPVCSKPLYCTVQFEFVSPLAWKYNYITFKEADLMYVSDCLQLMDELNACINEKITDFFSEPEEDNYEYMDTEAVAELKHQVKL